MKSTVLLLFAMFMLSSCNSAEEVKAVNNAGTTSDSGDSSSGGAADISGIDVKGFIVNRFSKTGVCTEIGGAYYRTQVHGSGAGANTVLQLVFVTFPDSSTCQNNYNSSNEYSVNFRLDKAVILEDRHIKLELTVDSYDPNPTIGNFDDYNSYLASIHVGQKEYWRIELDFTLPDSDVVLPRGQDFLSSSTSDAPNEGQETYTVISGSI